MLFLSIDVGIRNLAYIVLSVDDETETSTIIDWNIMEMCEKDENACKVDNVKIGIRMKAKMSELLEKFVFDKIIIENQIGPLALRMKMIQGMISQHFIENNLENIEFINASNKLKDFLKGKKTTYNERKKLSISITKNILEKKPKLNTWTDYFNKNSKKDDLADAFLQCLWYINNIINKK